MPRRAITRRRRAHARHADRCGSRWLPQGPGRRHHRHVDRSLRHFDLRLLRDSPISAILRAGRPTAALLATFAIFAVGFFLRPLGAVIFGHVGDRFGRRTALAFSLLLMTLATVAFGLLPTYAAVGLLAPVLLLCRVLQGLSVSAEPPGATLLILE